MDPHSIPSLAIIPVPAFAKLLALRLDVVAKWLTMSFDPVDTLATVLMEVVRCLEPYTEQEKQVQPKTFRVPQHPHPDSQAS